MKVLLKLVALAAITSIPALQTPSTHGAEHAYIGSKKCRPCHIREYRSWSTTKMASALDILKPGQRKDVKESHGLDPNKDYSTDATCLPCHTTGYGKEKGFTTARLTPQLAAVGCEVCHGPRDRHAGEMEARERKGEIRPPITDARLVRRSAGTPCALCHTAERDPRFKQNLARRLREVTHR